jgi:adenylate kinase
MNFVFIGPQASGKGTQARIIAKKLGLIHISTGDLLRNIHEEIKQEVDNHLNKGELVPDKLMIKILKEHLSKEEKGFILDGFPRNLSQAKELIKNFKIDKFIEISISDELAIKRLSGRLNCKKCGALYNILTSPKPKKQGICDKCGGELYKRKDDNKEAIKKRLETYHRETEPILKKYPSFKVDGNKSIKEVTRDILRELEKN